MEAQAIRSLGQVTDSVLLADVYNYGIIEGKIRPQDMTVSCSLTLNIKIR